MKKNFFFFVLVLFIITTLFGQISFAFADTNNPDNNRNGIPDWVETSISNYCSNPQGKYTVFLLWFEPYYLTPPYGATSHAYQARGVGFVCPSAPYTQARNAFIQITNLNSRFGIANNTRLTIGTIPRGRYSPVQALSRNFNISGLTPGTCYLFDATYHAQASYNGGTDVGNNTTASLYVCTAAAPPTTFSISGTVFIDTNRNGVRDSGEAGYSGARVQWLSLFGVKTTDSSGNYIFNNLFARTYTITLTVPAGYQATTATSQSVCPTFTY